MLVHQRVIPKRKGEVKLEYGADIGEQISMQKKWWWEPQGYVARNLGSEKVTLWLFNIAMV